jgi:N-methylhydantoinase A
LPVIEMIEIGAGGGSIAHIDSMGLLKVGPQSAGACPGPACYGLGGQEPTVTDADLVLGYLDADFFLGGEMALDKAKAEESIKEKIARPLSLDLVQAAWGIHQVVNENMANAARIHAVEKGEDAARYTMVAFGGAGPVHAYGLCQRLGIKKMICPLRAGVISALGFLIAPLSFDMVRSHVCRLDMVDHQLINKIFHQMEEEGKALLTDAGVREDQISALRSADMRYQGQGHEIAVPIPAGELTGEGKGFIQESFDIHYKRLYQRTIPNTPVEALNWRVTLQGPRPKINLRPDISGPMAPAAALKETRPVYFSQAGEFILTEIYDRSRLLPGARFSGPAVVEERESTLIMGPGSRAAIDDQLNLVVTLE